MKIGQEVTVTNSRMANSGRTGKITAAKGSKFLAERKYLVNFSVKPTFNDSWWILERNLTAVSRKPSKSRAIQTLTPENRSSKFIEGDCVEINNPNMAMNKYRGIVHKAKRTYGVWNNGNYTCHSYLLQLEGRRSRKWVREENLEKIAKFTLPTWTDGSIKEIANSASQIVQTRRNLAITDSSLNTAKIDVITLNGVDFTKVATPVKTQRTSLSELYKTGDILKIKNQEKPFVVSKVNNMTLQGYFAGSQMFSVYAAGSIERKLELS